MNGLTPKFLEGIIGSRAADSPLSADNIWTYSWTVIKCYYRNIYIHLQQLLVEIHAYVALGWRIIWVMFCGSTYCTFGVSDYWHVASKFLIVDEWRIGKNVKRSARDQIDALSWTLRKPWNISVSESHFSSEFRKWHLPDTSLKYILAIMTLHVNCRKSCAILFV